MNMTLQQQIGQLLMVGWQTPNAADMIENIKRYNFGNVILFTRNIRSASQVADMCAKIQETAIEYNGAPALISIDQEGGSVRRIYDGVTAIPGNMAVAAAESAIPSGAMALGKIVGSELKSLGINMNLAPVVDINSNPFNPVIAVRSYGDDPIVVSRLASQFALGMQEQRVMACYKHFMGHGDVDIDSHIDLPRVRKSFEELDACELIPYKDCQTDAIMSAHILYPEVDDRFPSSISRTILKGILRDKLNYGGLIVSDCFEMDGLIRTFSFEEAAIFGINATCDILTVSHSFGRQLVVRNALLKAAENGEINREYLKQSLKRIALAKEKYCVPVKCVPDKLQNERMAKRVSEASVTVISGKPFEIDENSVSIGVANLIGTVAEDKNVEKVNVASVIGEEFAIPHLNIDNLNFNMSEVLNFARGKKVVLCLTDSHLALVQKVLYSNLLQADCRVMLISMRTPYDVLNQDSPECHICIYEYTALSVRSLMKVLNGQEAVGVCPVRLKIKQSDAPIITDRTAFLTDRIIKFVQYNYPRKISLKTVADEFLISEGHVSKVIKKKTNKNFVDLLNEIRISEAKKLLTGTNMRINEVGTLVGYADMNYFARIFKSMIGVTPTFYRNNSTIND